MLKITEIELELLTNFDMVMFVEREIRGGILQCASRNGKADNNYMSSSDFNNNIPTSYLIYFDVNHLYTLVMCSSVPQSNFKWVNDIYSVDNIEEILDDYEFGYIFKVLIHYQRNL